MAASQLEGFSVSQPAIGEVLVWLPALGTPELDHMVNALLPGPVALPDKRAHISMDFFEFSRRTGRNFKFYAVPVAAPTSSAANPARSPAGSAPTQSPAGSAPTQSFGSNCGSSFNTSPVVSDSSVWTPPVPVFSSAPAAPASSTPAAPASSAPAAAPASSTRKPKTTTPKPKTARKPKVAPRSKRKQPMTADLLNLPGMKIVTADGRDVTDLRTMGLRSRAQREHTNLMRLLRVCEDCRRKKIRCDPSHKGTAAACASALSACASASASIVSPSASASVSASAPMSASASMSASAPMSASPAMSAKRGERPPLAAPPPTALAINSSSPGAAAAVDATACLSAADEFEPPFVDLSEQQLNDMWDQLGAIPPFDSALDFYSDNLFDPSPQSADFRSFRPFPFTPTNRSSPASPPQAFTPFAPVAAQPMPVANIMQEPVRQRHSTIPTPAPALHSPNPTSSHGANHLDFSPYSPPADFFFPDGDWVSAPRNKEATAGDSDSPSAGDRPSSHRGGLSPTRAEVAAFCAGQPQDMPQRVPRAGNNGLDPRMSSPMPHWLTMPQSVAASTMTCPAQTWSGQATSVSSHRHSPVSPCASPDRYMKDRAMDAQAMPGPPSKAAPAELCERPGSVHVMSASGQVGPRKHPGLAIVPCGYDYRQSRQHRHSSHTGEVFWESTTLTSVSYANVPSSTVAGDGTPVLAGPMHPLPSTSPPGLPITARQRAEGKHRTAKSEKARGRSDGKAKGGELRDGALDSGGVVMPGLLLVSLILLMWTCTWQQHQQHAPDAPALGGPLGRLGAAMAMAIIFIASLAKPALALATQLPLRVAGAGAVLASERGLLPLAREMKPKVPGQAGDLAFAFGIRRPLAGGSSAAGAAGLKRTVPPTGCCFVAWHY